MALREYGSETAFVFKESNGRRPGFGRAGPAGDKENRAGENYPGE